MPALYRIKTSLLEFDATGRIEKAEGAALLRLTCTTDQALAVQADVKAERRIEILALVGDEVVMPGWTSKVKARPDGASVDLACLLG